MIGIYKITNIVTGYIYIGRSMDIENRFESHKKKSSNKNLRESILKYGIDNHKFEIEEICLEIDLEQKERIYIFLYGKINNLFNISVCTENNTRITHYLFKRYLLNDRRRARSIEKEFGLRDEILDTYLDDEEDTSLSLIIGYKESIKIIRSTIHLFRPH